MLWHPGILPFKKAPVLRPFPTRNGKLHASILTADRRRDRPAHKDPRASRITAENRPSPADALIRAAIIVQAAIALLAFPVPTSASKQKGLRKAGFLNTGCATGHRRTTTGTGAQFWKKVFRGWLGAWGRKGQLLQQTPVPSPSQNPGKNHASTGRRASMAALSRTRWLELPRKSSSRSRNAST